MNLAALWHLPVLFICENNFYAMGTALNRYQSQTDLAKKTESYAIKSETVDGMDVLAVKSATGRAAQYVRENSKPFLLVAKTYRFRAHSMYDPDLYRTKEEIEDWKRRCPITCFESLLLKDGAEREDDFKEIETEVEREINEAVAFAEAGELEPVENLTKDVYTII